MEYYILEFNKRTIGLKNLRVIQEEYFILDFTDTMVSSQCSTTGVTPWYLWDGAY